MTMQKKPTVARIEQAMKDAIHGLGRNYIRNVKSYAGEFALSSDDALAQVIKMFPAVWVLWSHSDTPKREGKKWLVKHHFVVIVGAQSSRTEETARHGAYKQDGTLINVGSYQLIEDVETALLNNDLNLDGVDFFQPAEVRPFTSDATMKEKVSIVAYKWTVLAEKVSTSNDENSDYIETVSVNYVDGKAVRASDAVKLRSN